MDNKILRVIKPAFIQSFSKNIKNCNDFMVVVGRNSNGTLLYKPFCDITSFQNYEVLFMLKFYIGDSRGENTYSLKVKIKNKKQNLSVDRVIALDFSSLQDKEIYSGIRRKILNQLVRV